MKTIDALLREAPLFHGLTDDELTLIAGCGRNVTFAEDDVLFREGDAADTFYVVRHGRVALGTKGDAARARFLRYDKHGCGIPNDEPVQPLRGFGVARQAIDEPRIVSAIGAHRDRVHVGHFVVNGDAEPATDGQRRGSERQVSDDNGVGAEPSRGSVDPGDPKWVREHWKTEVPVETPWPQARHALDFHPRLVGPTRLAARIARQHSHRMTGLRERARLFRRARRVARPIALVDVQNLHLRRLSSPNRPGTHAAAGK